MWNPLRASKSLRHGALLAAFTAVLVSPDAGAQATTTKTTIAVLEFENSAMPKQGEFQGITVGLQVMLASALQTNPNIRVVEREQIQKLLDEQNLGTAGRLDAATAARVGRLLGAQHMLMGTIVVQMNMEARMVLRAVNSETGEWVYTETIDGRGDKIFKMIDQLASKANAGLKLPGDRDSKAAKQEGLDGPNQQEALAAIHAAERYKERGDLKAATAYYEKAIKLNPGIGYARREIASIARRNP